MQKIVPYLWFDNQAEAAAELYAAAIPRSSVGAVSRHPEGGPNVAGTVMTVTMNLDGLEVIALNGGPYFTFTPAASLFVTLSRVEEIDRAWKLLSDGGYVMMELGAYPFSEKFGWVADRFGFSWQLNLDTKGAARAAGPTNAGTGGESYAGSCVSPFLTFVGDNYGKAEEAMNFYIKQFDRSGVDYLQRHAPGEDRLDGTVKHAGFRLAGEAIKIMESGIDHKFAFTPAFSLFVHCKDQAEVDRYWNALLEGGRESQCGWLEDRYGVTWQIVPSRLEELLADPDRAKSRRVMEAMLKMVKLDVAGLERAYRGE